MKYDIACSRCKSLQPLYDWWQVHYRGRAYYFCSDKCKDKWFPETWTARFHKALRSLVETFR